MENRISEVIGTRIERVSSDLHPIIIVDWKDITNEGVKVHNKYPIINPNTRKEIKGAVINNKNRIEIQIDAFCENALKYTKKKQSKQCECVLYPCGTDKDEWLLFVETKYANNINNAFDSNSKYPETAIEQIKQTVRFFRACGIIDQDKVVNAIISFPNIISQFSGFVFCGEESEMDILKSDRIIIRATNYAKIISQTEIVLVSELEE